MTSAKNPTQKEINKALTKMLHSYEALMQNPKKEIKKWYNYGEPEGCVLCLIFRDIDAEINSTRSFPPECGECPLANISSYTSSSGYHVFYGSFGCIDRVPATLISRGGGTFEVLLTAIYRYKYDRCKFDDEKELEEFKDIVKARYDWLLRKLDEKGYEYK